MSLPLFARIVAVACALEGAAWWKDISAGEAVPAGPGYPSRAHGQAARSREVLEGSPRSSEVEMASAKRRASNGGTALPI